MGNYFSSSFCENVKQHTNCQDSSYIKYSVSNHHQREFNAALNNPNKNYVIFDKDKMKIKHAICKSGDTVAGEIPPDCVPLSDTVSSSWTGDEDHDVCLCKGSDHGHDIICTKPQNCYEGTSDHAGHCSTVVENYENLKNNGNLDISKANQNSKKNTEMILLIILVLIVLLFFCRKKK